MRKIVLHGPTTDRHGNFRDSGETLTVGATDNDKTDLTTAAADDLIERGIGVTPTEDREGEQVGEEVAADEAEAADAVAEAPAVDPLDHDADGRKGGSRPGRAKA